MPPVIPNTLRPDELPEFQFIGPFGGINSEVPAGRIDNYGFYDTLNFIFRKSYTGPRPDLTMLSSWGSFASGPQNITIFSFYTNTGARVDGILTDVGLYYWDVIGQMWTQVDSGFTPNTSSGVWVWTVINQTLIFTRTLEGEIYSWDGSSNSIAVVDSSFGASYITEIDEYCIIANTDESGTNYTQRIRWCAPGNTADWTSYEAGTEDLLNSLGPIYGINSMNQQGIAYHRFGVTRIELTGIGTQPFNFVPFMNRGAGLLFPYTLCQYGDSMSYYVGENNIYSFDGTNLIPIGDRALDETGRRIGARTRIYQDLFSGSPLGLTIFAFLSNSYLGLDYNAFWLVIPGGNTWVYNIDEQSWTRYVYSQGNVVGGGPFSLQLPGLPIEDLEGPIDQLQGTIAELGGATTSAEESVIIAFDSTNAGAMNDNVTCQSDGTLVTGSLECGDFRHQKTLEKIRTTLVGEANNSMFTYSGSAQNGNSFTPITETIQTAGAMQSLITPITPPISGDNLNLTLDYAANSGSFRIEELSLIIDVGGEKRGV